MDALSLHPDLPGISPAVPTDIRRRQTVYTTAGTIYDPNAATPLQAPTRRCRTVRWPSSNEKATGDLVAGAKPYFPGYSPRDRSPVGRISSEQQYSPLRQNYDRAVTPPILVDQQQDLFQRSGMAVPSIRSGNVPPPPGLGFGVDKEDGTANANDVESDSSQEALVSQFRVKTLKSLASYPNPMQKTAKRVLDKARQPVVIANAIGINLEATPSTISYSSSDLTKDRPSVPLLRSVQSDRAPGRAFPGHPVKSTLRGLSKYAPIPQIEYQKSTRQALRGTENLPGSGSKSASIAGVPEPLTAGPPGQRRYQPSTIEPVVNTLRGNGQSYRGDMVKRQLSGYKPRDSSRLFDLPVSELLPSLGGEAASEPSFVYGDDCDEFPAKPVSSSTDAALEEMYTGSSQAIHETLGPEALRRYYPGGLPSNYKGRPEAIQLDWATKASLRASTLHPMTAEEIAARNAEVDKMFYGGAGDLKMTLADVDREAEHGIFERAVGIVGQVPVPRRSGQVLHVGYVGKPTYPQISVEDANCQESRQHAEPLLIKLYASLLNYGEDGASRALSDFKPPAAMLLDRSERGSQSYFGWTRKEKRSRAKPRRIL